MLKWLDMKREKSVDGIILRKRKGSRLTSLSDPSVRMDNMLLDNEPPTPAIKSKRVSAIRVSIDRPSRSASAISSNSQKMDRDLEEALSSIYTDKDSKKKPSRTERKQLKKEKKLKHRTRRRVIKTFICLIFLTVISVAGWMYINANDNFCKITSSEDCNIFTLINTATARPTPLKSDENGRVNVLVLGTADDDEGHDGGQLTDSIMIISAKQNVSDNGKEISLSDVYMISLPRDLWVDYGRACPAGYRGKINAAYSCYGGATDNIDEDRAALDEMREFYGEILDLDIQYAVNVNYTVFRDAINAVGGKITVEINSRDARGILDATFDGRMCGKTAAEWQKRCPTGHFLQLTNGVHEIDAEMALALALARGTFPPTYGLERSNFDREQNQQLVIKATLKQATSAGILTNPAKITALLDSLGNNLRTTFNGTDIKTLMTIAGNIQPDDMQSLSLIDENLLRTDMINGQSVVVPAAGTFNYSNIRAFLKENLSSNPLTREKAVVAVYNATDITGEAARIVKLLTDANINANANGNTETSVGTQYVVYDLTEGKKPESAKLIAKTLGGIAVKEINKSDLPADVNTNADFVVIVGK